ncbi:MAG: hypothetical protein ABJE66_29475 [Deltaproteobacteria bacterium]
MFRMSLGMVFAVAVGCSHPNKGVCCETAAQCEVIGLSADSVGKYNCDDGLVCVNEACVIPPDASSSVDGAVDGAGSGSGSGTSNGRCDLAKPFAAPVLVPNINTGYDELHFMMSSNELTAYILRDDPGDNDMVTSTTRGSIDDDFPIDVTDSALVNVGSGRINNPHIARSDHLWFEMSLAGLYVSQRTNTTEPFGAHTLLTIGSITNSGLRLIGTDPDALVLYFLESDGILQAAANHFSASDFAEPVPQSSFALADGAISRDGLTLYYEPDGLGDVYVSKRSSTSVMFDAGTLILPAAGDPAYVSQDGCELYISGSDVSVARRPM